MRESRTEDIWGWSSNMYEIGGKLWMEFLEIAFRQVEGKLREWGMKKTNKNKFSKGGVFNCCIEVKQDKN